MRRNATTFIKRHSIVSYFVLTFAISWTGAFCVVAPQLLRHKPLSQLIGILTFPVMLLGPSTAGIVLTWMVDGRSGLHRLFHRIFRQHIPVPWSAALLIPPVLIVAILFVLETIVSPVYKPNFFLLGIAFGVPAGFLEEIGWTGYAFPRMLSASGNVTASSIVLGLLWGAWHLPVVNYLGTATPHGSYWWPFVVVFTIAMTAMRVLICWMYSHTGSVFLAQLMHVSSTGSLVVFSPPRVTAAQEVFWYALYGALLWLVASSTLISAKWEKLPPSTLARGSS